jgi:hypothetical protein
MRKPHKSHLTEEDVRFILNALRQASVKWSGRNECLRRARKKKFDRYNKTTGSPIFKYYWQCAKCAKWERDVANMEVDHIEEIGPFLGSFDVHIPRIFCAQENLQALCISCHMKKTNLFNNARLNWKRKK